MMELPPADIMQRFYFFFALLLVILNIGCVDRYDVEQPRFSSPAGEIHGSITQGQTFTALENGLCRIDILLTDYHRVNYGKIVFHLREDINSAADLFLQEIDAETVKNNKYRSFRFKPISDSAGRSFYFFLDALGAAPGNAVSAWRSEHDVYPGGSLVMNHQPVPGDITFKLFSRSDASSLVDKIIMGIGPLLGFVLLFFLLFCLPGVGILYVFGLAKRLNWRELWTAAPALSLALIPVFFLVAQALGVFLGPWLGWSLMLFGVLALRGLVKQRSGSVIPASPVSVKPTNKDIWADLALLATVILVIVVRFYSVEGINVPFWGDSLHHTVAADLMHKNRGLFSSWMPYAPYKTYTLHFGFSAIAAVFKWISGIPISRAVVLTGQIINVITILALYPLAYRLGKGNKWTGVFTLLAAGLLSALPAGYFNWGRYAGLTGNAILLAAIWLFWQAAESSENLGRTWRIWGLTGLVSAGLVLSYYRMPYYMMTFVVAWFLAALLRSNLRQKKQWLSLVAGMTIVAGIVAGLVLPRIIPMLQKKAAGSSGGKSGGFALIKTVSAEYGIWRDFFSFVSPLIAGVALLAVAYAVFRKRGDILLPFFWSVLLILLPFLRMLHLPVAMREESFAILITMYIPAVLLAGWLLGLGAGWLQKVSNKNKIIIFFIVMGLSFYGALRQQAVIRPFYRLVYPADESAMDWIKDNTPKDARFLVNGFLIYNGRFAAGGDAGWWLPLLARRENTLPPAYPLLFETPIRPGYSWDVVALIAGLTKNPPSSQEGLRLLLRWGITHVYIGQTQGKASFEAEALLDEKELIESPAFKLVFQEDLAKVFALDREYCNNVLSGENQEKDDAERF